MAKGEQSRTLFFTNHAKKTEDIIFPVEGALLNFFLNDVIFCHSIHILYSGLKNKPMSHHLSQYSISTVVFHFV